MLYPVGCYITAIYQNKWYVGEVLDKKSEDRALPGSEYVYVNYMERSDNNVLKWPERPDKLNTLMEDILFICAAPEPSHGTSSTRSIMYSLHPNDVLKANIMFKNKDIITQLINFFCFLTLSERYFHIFFIQKGSKLKLIV